MAENIDTRFMGKEFLTEFINIYKSHPALWKIKSNEYTNKNLKNRGYDALISYSKKIYPGADRNFVFKKIQNLRGCFRKELKKVASSKSTGAGRDDLYGPRLWYFDLLLFTTDHEIPIQSVESENLEEPVSPNMIEAESEEEHFENVLELSENESEVNYKNTQESLKSTFRKPSTPKRKEIIKKSPTNRKKMQLFQEKHENFMQTCTEVLKQKDDVTDEFDAVGINVSAKLRKMDPMQQVLAESLITKILAKGLFKELTRLTDVSDSSATSNTFSWQAASSTDYTYSSSTTTTSSTQPDPQPSISRALCTYYSDAAQDISYDV